jgi:hypothetical protein
MSTTSRAFTSVPAGNWKKESKAYQKQILIGLTGRKQRTTGIISLYVKGKKFVSLAYENKSHRSGIIARWKEEFEGEIEIRIKPN